MLGFYRFAMAIIVAAHHAGWWPRHYKVGIACVMAFLMISGHGISALGERFFPADAGGRVRAPFSANWPFWQDRVLRIYPQYYVWLIITAFVVLGLHRHWLFHGGQPDWINVLCNLTIFPVSFFMYIPSLAALFILPQAWSLSIELFFYALFPALVRWRWLGWVCAMGGLAVFSLASLGVLNTEYYTYRLLPGALPYIMLGRAVWTGDLLMQVVIVAGFMADLALVWVTGHLTDGLNRELLFGILPSFLLFRAAAACKPVRGDRALGNMTYGIYLSHMVVLAWISASVHDIYWRVGIVVTGAIVLGAASYALIEVPITRLRRRLKPAPPSSARAGSAMSPTGHESARIASPI